MATIDSLITNAESRTNSWGANAATTINVLLAAIENFDLTDFTIFDDILLDISSVTAPTYAAPDADATALPTYSAPASSLPSVQTMSGITAPDVPTFNTTPVVIPDAPTILIDGLFLQTAPTDQPPSWAYSDPDLGIAALIAEMAAVAKPTLTTLTFPTLEALDIGDVPTAPIPDYDPPFAAEMMRDADDYSAMVTTQYDTAIREIQEWCDSKVTALINTYAPDYHTTQAALSAKIASGMDGTILPTEYEAALQTRARSRITRDFFNAEQAVRNESARLGFVDPPGSVVSAIRKNRLESANALAVNSNEIYINAREKEIQHLQFVMQLSAQQTDSIRSAMMQYLGIVIQMLGQAVAKSELFVNAATKLFDHLIARGQFQLDLLKGTREQYDTLLKNALSRLEGFKLELDAAKSKKEVELMVTQNLEAQIKAQALQVQAYGEIIDAIAKRAGVSELYLKDIQTKADVFSRKVEAVKTEYDIFNLALSGDKYKLEGQMAKLEKYKTEIDAITAGYQAIETALKGVDLSNDQKIKTFDQQERLYKIDLEEAVQAFTGAAEKKKLAIQSRGTELEGAINLYRGKVEGVGKFVLDPIIEEYRGRINWIAQRARMGVDLMQTSTSGYQAAANVAGGIAQSSAGALNTMVNGSASLTA